MSLTSTLQSISAEIYIFLLNWQCPFYNNVNEESDKKQLKWFKKSMFLESINNAYMKMCAFDNKEAEEIISKVKFDNSILQNIWKSYFSSDNQHLHHHTFLL